MSSLGRLTDTYGQDISFAKTLTRVGIAAAVDVVVAFSVVVVAIAVHGYC